MKERVKEFLKSIEESVDDPRIDRRKYYKLGDIIFMTLCAVIAGCDTWTEIALFAKTKRDWFVKLLNLQGNTPSHDTFSRVFSLLSPKSLNETLLSFLDNLKKDTKNDVVALDGKTLRRSFDKKKNKRPFHILRAWSTKNNLVLGFAKVDDKSNEIDALPKMIDKLAIEEATITIDAMGCQKKIVKKIHEKSAHYVIALKKNQKNLFEKVQFFLEDVSNKNFSEAQFDSYQTIEKDHGRIEKRWYWISDDIDWLPEKKTWKGLKSVGMVRATRIIDEKETTEMRFYISSLKPNAQRFSEAVRGHWAIENSCHWSLDVAFREDDSRVRDEYAAQNLSLIRTISLSKLKADTSTNAGIKARRGRAGWDESFLLKTLLNPIC